MYVANAFSLLMLPAWVTRGAVKFQRLSLDEARTLAREENLTSAVGHADIAALISSQLGIDVQAQRINALLDPGGVDESVLVAQYAGPRLPEGATALPEGARIEWILVTLGEEGILEFSDVELAP